MKARVVHIITKLELGGAQQNTLYTVENLDRGRFSVALISGDHGIMNDDAQAIANLDFTIVPDLVREINPLKDLKALLHLRKLLAKEAKDAAPAPVIVHTHSSKAGILGRLAAFLAGVPVVIHTFHGFGFNDFQPRLKKSAFIAAEWLVGKVTDYFIAVSRANLDRAVSLRFGKAEKMRVIRSGIDIDMFDKREIDRSAMRQELGVGTDGPLVAMVACLKPQKSPLDFAGLAALVLKDVPDAWFVECGDGELRGDLENEVSRLGIGERFKLAGWRRDIPEILWASDLLVLTSLWEGLPRVYPQAMAAALPIVGTRVDGAAEAVVDGRNGYLFDPHDIEGMAARVIQLLHDPDQMEKMGRAGRAAVDEFDIRKMVTDQEELYEELIS